jgi:hypothetical protein
MVGDGQIWFSGVCAGKDRDTPCADKVIKVITVNTKLPAAKQGWTSGDRARPGGDKVAMQVGQRGKNLFKEWEGL